MGRLDYKLYYERHLPHIQPAGASFFITSRLAGSLPHAIVVQLQMEAHRREQEIAKIEDEEERERRYDLAQRRLFGRLDAALDRATQGPFWLGRPEIARIVADSAHFLDGRHYDLVAYCIMPNHLHLVCTPREDGPETYVSLSRIGHSLKGFTAHEANDVLGRKGAFWQQESCDHWARDADELGRIVSYVMNNPVKAGLVEEWSAWPWTYVRDMP